MQSVPRVRTFQNAMKQSEGMKNFMDDSMKNRIKIRLSENIVLNILKIFHRLNFRCSPTMKKKRSMTSRVHANFHE